jgi:hypothetical protein
MAKKATMTGDGPKGWKAAEQDGLKPQKAVPVKTDRGKFKIKG